ncbi:MAG: hypothetical protein JJE13_02980 [Thermoleophilia bacterium]|nr:hypothetical protein [Thermoleophilia bacterium]
MSDSEQIIVPTETIQLPAPSWGPAFFALGVMGMLAGLFANDFMFPAWAYGLAGFIFFVGAIRSMSRKGSRAFYSLPREQGDARAELPVESFSAPTRE